MRVLICLILCFSLLYACTDEQDVFNPPRPNDEECVLNYTIETLDPVVTSYSAPSSEEYRIKSLLYLFFDEEEVCCGYTVYNNLTQVGQEGALPYKIPADLDVTRKYIVRLVANLNDYTDVDIAEWASLHVGLTWNGFSNMYSSLNGSRKPHFIGSTGMLLAAEFNLTNSTTDIVVLKRRVCAVDVMFEDAPIDISIDSVALSAVPANIVIFDDVAIDNNLVVSNQFTKLDKSKLLRLYVLPNLNRKDTVKLKLLGTRSVYKDNGDVGETNEMEISREKFEITFPLYGSLRSTLLKANQVININIFKSVRRPDSLSCLINKCYMGKSNRIEKIGADEVVSISETDIKFGFSSSYPLNDWGDSSIPDGSISKEIFLTFSGNAYDFEINQVTEPWLTVSRNRLHNSLIVTASSNFSIAADGLIISAARSIGFSITFPTLAKTISFNVFQNKAPSIPVPVTLESGLTVYDKNCLAKSNAYCSATTSTRSVYDREAQMYSGKYYYGDISVRSEYFAVGKFGSDNAGYVRRIPADISTICPEGYHLPSLTNLCVDLYPYLRMHHQEMVDAAGLRTAVLVFYTTNGANQIVYFPLIGCLGTIGYYWQNTLQLMGYFNPEEPTKKYFEKYGCHIYGNCGISLSGSPKNNHLQVNERGVQNLQAYPLRCVKK